MKTLTKIKKTKIDKEKCIGCGICASQCPNYYTVSDETMLASVNDDAIEPVENLLSTIDNCPTGAISWDS